MGGPRTAAAIADAPAGLGAELKTLLANAGMAQAVPEAPQEPRKRRTRLEPVDEEAEIKAMFRNLEIEATTREKAGRECPVPKPSGKIGELLGFGRDGRGRKPDEER
jgi:hypothetical protein